MWSNWSPIIRCVAPVVLFRTKAELLCLILTVNEWFYYWDTDCISWDRTRGNLLQFNMWISNWPSSHWNQKFDVCCHSGSLSMLKHNFRTIQIGWEMIVYHNCYTNNNFTMLWSYRRTRNDTREITRDRSKEKAEISHSLKLIRPTRAA